MASNMLAYNTREQEQDLEKIYLLLNFKLVLRLRWIWIAHIFHIELYANIFTNSNFEYQVLAVETNVTKLTLKNK